MQEEDPLMSRTLARRGRRVAAVSLTLAVASVPLALAGSADAAIVSTVPLATSANYSVLGGQTVTNTGPSILGLSLGLSPGSSITGFPPGLVLAPGTTDETNPAAAAAQSDLTTGYLNAAGRPVNATTTADLANLTLQAGVYAGPSKSALQLTGPLVLDGAGDPNSVFIFQTDSSLTTGSASTVTLINGAQGCNGFWQVGSSATLGTGSTFAGNILALSDITVTTGVTVHGRALARNGEVTLDDDVFTAPTCDMTPLTTPATAAAVGDTPADSSTDTGLTSTGSGGPGVPGLSGPPKTDGGPSRPTSSFPWIAVTLGGAAALVGTGSGAAALRRARTRLGRSGS
jgi:hypothetical protein